MATGRRQPYKVQDGTRVPGVTTILGRFKNAAPLMHWAWNEGMEGRDYRDTRDAAASAGTLAHDMVFAHLKDQDFYPPEGTNKETLARVENAFNQYLSWEGMTQLEIISLEEPMVSETYRYGGTPDAMLKLDGKLAIGDWKASNSVYVEYLCQVAAYKHLWEESHPGQPITGGAHILRFDKENGDFAHYHYSDVEDAWELFKHYLAAYDLDKVLSKRVK